MATKTELQERIWLGVVVDNDDPEQLGRCRIKVYSLFDDLEDTQVPWAFPVTNNSFAGGGGGFGSISIPKIGAIVRVQFSEGNIYSPEYYGIQTINRAMQADIADSYLNSHVIAYDEDEQMKVYYTPGKGLTIFHKESQVIINPDSSITIEHKDSQSIIELVGDTINVVSQNEVNVTSTNTVNITTENVVIDHSNTIELGAGAAEKLVLGDSFLSLFNSHTHLGNMGAPTSPPIQPMTPANHLSGKTGTPVVKTI
jgi:hypothetical protein